MNLEPLIEIQKDLSPPDGRSYWTDPQEYGARPTFTAKEVASVFFGRGKLWFNPLLHQGRARLDGELIEIPRTEAGARQFQLHHVELIAHAFLYEGIIDLRRFRNAIRVIRAIADNYRLL